MSDDSMTGPWVLALGTLAVGVVALTAELLRHRGDEEGQTLSDADGDRAVNRGVERQ